MVLDGVQDPGNAGAIVRAAEAFGATGVVFLKGTVSPFNPKTLRASAGSLFRVPFVLRRRTRPLVRRVARAARDRCLRRRARQRRPDARRSRDVDLTRPCALIIGSEAHGVSAELRARRRTISIPTVRRGIAERGGGRGHPPVRSAAPEDARADEPVRHHAARIPTRPRIEAAARRAHAPAHAWKTTSARSTFSGRASRCAQQIERDELSSMILWGPPGVGKTTLAQLIARITHCEFIPFSAVLSGIKEIKAVMADAEKFRRLGRRTILFIDEIHRFNKAQQDAFLPYVERGDIILIGATTENPSFEVISALLSRSRCTRCAR